MITINMNDGEQINIHQDTILVGYDNHSNKDVYYLKRSHISNLQGDFDEFGPSLATSDERIGIAGFLLSHEIFTIGEDYDATMYFTKSVKSISIT